MNVRIMNHFTFCKRPDVTYDTEEIRFIGILSPRENTGSERTSGAFSPELIPDNQRYMYNHHLLSPPGKTKHHHNHLSLYHV